MGAQSALRPTRSCRPFVTTAYPSPLVLNRDCTNVRPSRRHPVNAIAPSWGEHRGRGSKRRRRPKPLHPEADIAPPRTPPERNRGSHLCQLPQLRAFDHVPSEAAPCAEPASTPGANTNEGRRPPEIGGVFEPVVTESTWAHDGDAPAGSATSSVRRIERERRSGRPRAVRGKTQDRGLRRRLTRRDRIARRASPYEPNRSAYRLQREESRR